MDIYARHVWWQWQKGANTFRYKWDQIHRNSYVVVTASEGSEVEFPKLSATTALDRFVADASYTVRNIAPLEGAVDFSVAIDWHEARILWTDIILIVPEDIRVDIPSFEGGGTRSGDIKNGLIDFG